MLAGIHNLKDGKEGLPCLFLHIYLRNCNCFSIDAISTSETESTSPPATFSTLVEGTSDSKGYTSIVESATTPTQGVASTSEEAVTSETQTDQVSSSTSNILPFTMTVTPGET